MPFFTAGNNETGGITFCPAVPEPPGEPGAAPTGVGVEVQRSIITVKLQEAVFPQLSITEQVTVVFPSVKFEPLGGAHTSLADDPWQPPVAIGVVQLNLRLG